jgi:hypothetical protein
MPDLSYAESVRAFYEKLMLDIWAQQGKAGG